MEEILNSVINGQRKQALEQLKNSSYMLDDLFEYLLDKNMPDEIIKMYRIALNVGYIKM